jgi:DNA adenine methylase
MGLEADHRRLGEVLRSTPATVLLSGYHSPLYDELYGDWWRLEVPVLVHASNSTTAARGQRTEVLWANRELSDGQLAFHA